PACGLAPRRAVALTRKRGPGAPQESSMPDTHQTVLVVLGGGPGGYAAAFLAADKGMQTTLIDSTPKPGGTCLHVGCIPSKALLHAADIIHSAHDALDFGIKFPKPEIDL